ncbi:MAG: deoxynucleoside kinase [Candidatus Calescibacterium sp.]|nr:deoxynucleoside kinase [Candidatus Calescibacterium sp.]MDW8195343.1 deoxynucleoside kinase [Candidatus Calescibacterium sp.]
MSFSIISIEGVDGSGKTTISNLLYQRISYSFPNLNIQKYHEPMFFNHEIYQTSIESSRYLLLLFLTSRKKLIQQVNPNEGQLVIIDRYVDSTFVYQCLFQKAIDFETLMYLHEKIIFEDKLCYWPDITFILEANSQDIKNRIKQKNNSKLFDNCEIEHIMYLYRNLPLIFPNRVFYFFNTSNLSESKIVETMFEIIVKKSLFYHKR